MFKEKLVPFQLLVAIKYIMIANCWLLAITAATKIQGLSYGWGMRMASGMSFCQRQKENANKKKNDFYLYKQRVLWAVFVGNSGIATERVTTSHHFKTTTTTTTTQSGRWLV